MFHRSLDLGKVWNDLTVRRWNKEKVDVKLGSLDLLSEEPGRIDLVTDLHDCGKAKQEMKCTWVIPPFSTGTRRLFGL